MALVKCRECGDQVSDQAHSCPHCGVPDPGMDVKNYYKEFNAPSTETDTVSCRECGKDLAENTDTCPHCGAPDPGTEDYVTPEISQAQDSPPPIVKEESTTSSDDGYNEKHLSSNDSLKSEYENAKRGVDYGFKVCLFLAVLSAVLTTKALLLDGFERDNDPWSYNDPWIYLVCILFVGLGFAIRKYSRTVAVSMLLFYIINAIYAIVIMSSVESPGWAIGFGLLLFALIFGLVFTCLLRGVLGAFKYHRLRRSEDPDYRPAPKWAYYIGIPLSAIVGVVLSVLFAMGLMAHPATVSVLPGSQLSEKDVSYLVDNNIIDSNEQVLLFYSVGPFSIFDDGNILTDERVISYTREEGDLTVYNTSLENIEGFEITEKGDSFSDSALAIFVKKGEDFLLFLATEEGGDQRFLNELNSLMSEKGLVRSEAVIEGSDLLQSEISFLVSENIINQNEQIKLFYSTGYTQILDEGNILTENRLISYFRDEDGLGVAEVLIKNIKNTQLIEQEEDSDLNLFEITDDAGETFQINLPVNDAGSDQFLDAIRPTK
jgi:ribosomal protein L37E